MLSFPSPKWRAALTAAMPPDTKNPSPGSRFGRAPSLIVPRLYLSGIYTAKNREELIRLGITHVVSILEHSPPIPDIIPPEHRLYISLEDKPDADILSCLPATTNFITSALAENEENKILVHCFQGISRSATVVIAYLIASSGMPAGEATVHIQSKRGIVCPNSGFRRQLEKYAEGFVGGRERQKTSKVAKIGEDIAQRIRQLKMSSQQQS
ncbi:hypothetical protein H0H92_006308 [Tricholoma furcatifolium]|nr:hypothetical protein H0H92_006308 [Tricholoma furcatifolium]